jgi:S1-C subfamily serine protease
MRNLVQWLAGLCLANGLMFCGGARAAGTNDSIVKVFSQMRLPNPVRPWVKQNPIDVGGSGVVIDKNRILTNAHLVVYADEIFVQGGEGGDRVEAKVVGIAPAIDLAVLALEDESFFAKRPPIPRGTKLPEITSRVLVQGYPVGGNTLSTTQGTVTRIEY